MVHSQPALPSKIRISLRADWFLPDVNIRFRPQLALNVPTVAE